MKAVQMIPGYTHSITNLSQTQDLVTVMWANEFFDSSYPDTFYETVEISDFDQNINSNKEKGNA